MAKGKISIGAEVNVTAKEDGSLSKIEKRIEDMSNAEIKVKIDETKSAIKEIEKLKNRLGKKAPSIADTQLSELRDLLTSLESAAKGLGEVQKQQEAIVEGTQSAAQALGKEADAIKKVAAAEERLQKIRLEKPKAGERPETKKTALNGRFKINKDDSSKLYTIQDTELKKELTGFKTLKQVGEALVGIINQEATAQDSVTTSTAESIAAQQKLGEAAEETAKSIEKQAGAIERNAQAKKKASQTKLRDFTQEEYDSYTEKYEKEHDGENEYLEETIDLIRRASEFGTQFSADMTTSCKRATTAVKRFFSAFDPAQYPAIAGWKDSILESVQNGHFSEADKYNGMYTGSYSWGVEEALDENRYYVYLNLLDVVKDKEQEYSAYLEEEFKKRDEGLEKEAKLLYEIHQKYKQLEDLHRNAPEWDNDDQISSIQHRLDFYEKEKVLLQDINSLKQEMDLIPNKYRESNRSNESLRFAAKSLYLGEYGSSSLEGNEQNISFWGKELERATRRQEKNLFKDQVKDLVAQNGAIEGFRKVYEDLVLSVRNGSLTAAEAVEKLNEAVGQTNVGYHAGIISKLNKSESNGRFVGSNRGTGYYGTGHYFVDSAHKNELISDSSYSSLPFTSIDLSYYDDLFKANTDKIAGSLHSFLKNMTRFTQGSDSYSIEELFSQFEEVFGKSVLNIDQFTSRLQELTAFMQSSSLEDRRDSVSTQFMKSLGYGGVDTRGTKYADTKYGIVIYELKEESILQANITDELQKQGDMLDKISYKSGEVFDSKEDERIQGILDKQQQRLRIAEEYERIFDTTNLNKYGKELDALNGRLKEIDSTIANCKSTLNDIDKYINESFDTFASFGSDDTLLLDDSLREEMKQDSISSFNEAIRELTEERAQVVARLNEIQNEFNKEEQKSIAAYEQAEKNVLGQSYQEVGEAAETANESIKKVTISSEEAKKALRGIDFQRISEIYNIDRQDMPEIIEHFKELAALIQASLNGEDVNLAPKIQEIVNAMRALGGEIIDTENIYKDFIDYVKKSKIKYNDYWISNYGNEWEKDKYKNGKRIQNGTARQFSKYLVKDTSPSTIKNYAYADYPDQFIGNLPDQFKALFDDVSGDANSLNKILKAISRAEREVGNGKGTIVHIDPQAIEQEVQGFVDKIKTNLDGSHQSQVLDELLSNVLSTLDGIEVGKKILANGGKYTAKDGTTQTANTEDLKARLESNRESIRAFLDAAAEQYTVDLTEFEEEYNKVFDSNYQSLISGPIPSMDTTQTEEGLRRIAASANETSDAMGNLDKKEDEVESFTAEQVISELNRIQNAIHSSEAGLSDVIDVNDPSDTSKLQSALAAFKERIGSNSPFKLVSAQIDSMGESADQATLKFQSLDESMSFTQKWVMSDGELTLGRISASQSFKDKDTFDSELYQANATSKVDKLWSSLSGVEDVSQKVKDAFAAIRTEISQIDSKDALGKFKVSFDTLNNMVQEFKNNYKSLNSISDTVRVAQSKMANAETVLGAKETSISKYVDTKGYEEAVRIIGEMRTQLDNYKNTEQNLVEGEDPVQKRVEAYKEYIRLEKELDAQTKQLQAESQFDSFSKVMKDAQTEIDTATLKLQKFADVEGFDKANQEITKMTDAMNQFKSEDSSIEQKAQAVKDYEAAQKSLTKQMQYLSEVQKNTASETQAEPVNKVREYYDQYLQIVKQLNTVNKELYATQEKDAGTGVFSNVINQLQFQKDTLLNQLHDVSEQVKAEILNIYNPGDNEYSFNFSKYFSEEDTSTMAEFFNNARVQAELSTEEIQKFIDVASQSGKIDAEFGAKIAEQLSKIEELSRGVDKYNLGDKLISTEVGSGSLDQLYETIKKLSAVKLSRGTDWTGQEEANLQKLISTYTEYATTLTNTAKKQTDFFSNMTKFESGDTFDNTTIEQANKMADSIDNIKTKLTAAAQEFAKNRAIITGFTTTADGISKINFSVFDEGTKSIKTFTMASGSAVDGIYQMETTVSNSEKIFKSASTQLQSMTDLWQRLQDSGANMNQSGIVEFKQLMEELNKELLKENPDESAISKLTKDAKASSVELEKLIKKHQELTENAVDSRSINMSGDPYSQMVQAVKEYASGLEGTTLNIGKFNAQNNTLTYTLTEASGEVKTMKASLDSLSGSIVTQVTSIGQLGSWWRQFGTGMASIGSQLTRALIGFNAMYKVISMLRSGVTAVTEIDTAMTELRKVTDETEATYSRFLETAASTSSKIGTTMKEFTEATSDFARLGYTIEEATELSKAANIYTNVGDNISSVGEATESIISTMKGFGIEAENAMNIVDKFNEVGVLYAQVV